MHKHYLLDQNLTKIGVVISVSNIVQWVFLEKIVQEIKTVHFSWNLDLSSDELSQLFIVSHTLKINVRDSLVLLEFFN